MTTGQRIAAKRKELKLSQEALGEQLGVSRQSIYKWESDASLPEIDKLVSMSRLFSVRVGWLLGVEEEAAPQADPAPAQEDGELTPAQLSMVEEIVARYLAAQPAPKKRKKWPLVLAALVLLWGGFTLFSRLEQLNSRYDSLQNSISYVSSNVNSQINSITNRVEAVLKAQNDLTADYGAQLDCVDPATNTAVFSVHATPKTYVPGMQAYFLADWGGDAPTEVAARAENNGTFSAELTCPLTDSITLSVVFVTGDTRQTQLLDSFSRLYSSTLPNLDVYGDLLLKSNADGPVLADSVYKVVNYGYDNDLVQLSPEEFKTGVQLGLFVNFQLQTWLEPTEPEEWTTRLNEETCLFALPETALSLQPGDLVFLAAVYTDPYGRQTVAPMVPLSKYTGDDLEWDDLSDYTSYFDLSNYHFDPM